MCCWVVGSLETVVALEQAVKDARIWAARSDELCLLAAEAGALLERAVPEARATAKASSLERLEADMTRLATENLQVIHRIHACNAYVRNARFSLP